jgi:hypothetical protein
LITALRQGKNPTITLERLKECSSVWRSTVNRWRDYFLKIFPDSSSWRQLAGHVLIKGTNCLIYNLLALYYQKMPSAELALVECLQVLALGP